MCVLRWSCKPDAVLVSLDGRSAYDSMSRAAFLRELQRIIAHPSGEPPGRLPSQGCMARFHSRRSCVPRRPALQASRPVGPRPSTTRTVGRPPPVAGFTFSSCCRGLSLSRYLTALLVFLARRWVRLAVSLDTRRFWRGTQAAAPVSLPSHPSPPPHRAKAIL